MQTYPNIKYDCDKSIVCEASTVNVFKSELKTHPHGWDEGWQI